MDNTYVKHNANQYIDSITGLKNRNYLNNFIQDTISSKKIDKYSVLIMDLDDFRYINDFRGYIFGNKILSEISERLKEICLGESLVAYSGSNRFVIFNFAIVDSKVFAKKILKTIKKDLLIENVCVNLTASIGICDAHHQEELFIALQHADIALNKAKNNGKDCFAFFNNTIKSDLIRNMKIQNSLRKAIKKDLLEIYYQPKFNLNHEDYIGAEALLRWNDEELGSISPIEFIPIAEKTGIIIDLGRYVIDKVCKQISEWENRNIKYKKIAINLSSKQFKDNKLPKHIGSQLKKFNLSSDVIELEITESSFIENKNANYKFIKELLAENIEIAIDDFGTGYSSYNQLSNLSLNTLKVDKSFIDYITHDSKKSLIIKNIINLAHILDMKVVAEGVEEEEQILILKEYDCDIIQGYYFSKPLYIEDFEKYISQ